MKLTLGKPLTHFAILLLLLTGRKAFATHIVGLELYYSYVTGNTYNISLIAYGDCGPASAAAFATLSTDAPTICIYDGNTSVSNITLTIQAPAAGIEVTPVCPADVGQTQCTNTSFAIPGIKKFVYSGTYTVPYTSATWRFIFTGDLGGGNLAGRAAAITNISSGTTTQLEDTLNNTMYNNSSAVMTTVPVPFFCLNNPDSYNPGAVDPDNDSLNFNLIPGIAGTGSCAALGTPVIYNPPFSGAAPLDVAPGSFIFDQHTGQLAFFPTTLQRALVVYNVEEFRNGTFVGSCQREMTFLVLTCSDIPPSGIFGSTTAGTLGDSTHFYICRDSGAFILTIDPSEVDTNNNITVTAAGLPPGSLFNVTANGTHHPHCTLSGNSTSIPPGTYVYYLTFADDACPLSGSLTRAFSIIVVPEPNIVATGGAIKCDGPPVILKASGGLQYSWSPAADLACPTCDSNVVRTPFTQVYTVTGVDGYGCRGSDTAIVTVLPSYSAMMYNITPSQAVPLGGSVQLSVLGASYYYWTPNDGSLSNNDINNPIATPLSKTTYTVYGYNSGGCIDSATVTIDVITNTEVIPSAFSPNNDERNDVFRVSNLGRNYLVDMKIFNRWGQLIYQTNDNNKGWDGSWQGVPQDMGVYFYAITIEHADKTQAFYHGDVTLVR